MDGKSYALKWYLSEYLKKIEEKVNAFLNKLIKQYKNSKFTNEVVFSIPVFEDIKNAVSKI